MFEKLKTFLGIRCPVGDARGVASNEPMLEYAFENKRQPDGFGASRYAFETLQLAQSSPIDRAVRVRRPIIMPFQGPQIFAGQAVRTAPIPSQSGGIFTGGMITQDGDLPAYGTIGTVDMEAVARNDPSAGANDASAQWLFNNPA